MYILPKEASSKQWCQELKKKYTVLFVDGNGWNLQKKLAKIAGQYHIDIFHFHFYAQRDYMFLPYLCKAKVVVHLHNSVLRKKFWPLRRIYNRIASQGVSKMIGVSSYVKDTMIAAGYPAQKCIYVDNCIDFSRMDHTAGLTLDQDKVNLVILGTHFYRKGCDIAIEAMAPLVEKYNLCLQIATNNVEMTKRTLKENGYDKYDWIKVIPATEYIGDYYRSSFLLLSPSREEGFNYANIEALYCRCLFLKSDYPAMTYYLEGEEILTAKTDVEDYRRKLRVLLDMDPKVLKTLANRLHDDVVSKYAINKWGAKIREVYSSL